MMNRLIKTVLMAFAILLTLTGCQKKSSVSVLNETGDLNESYIQASADTVNTEMKMTIERGIVLDRVKSIYSLVRSENMFHGGSHESEWFDRAFCSKSWNKLLMDVRCKEDRTGTIFFEIDRWSMTRFGGELVSFDDLEVDNVWTNGKQMRASVSFVVYESDTYTPARIDLVYEDNRWVIDNFHNLRYMLNVRNSMLAYLAHDII